MPIPNEGQATMVCGNLTREPVLRHTNGSDPVPVTNFGIAVARPGTNNEADFMEITVWGRQAEHCCTTLDKGDRVIVFGVLQQKHWKKSVPDHSDLTVEVSTVEIIAHEVAMSLKYKDWNGWAAKGEDHTEEVSA